MKNSKHTEKPGAVQCVAPDFSRAFKIYCYISSKIYRNQGSIRLYIPERNGLSMMSMGAMIIGLSFAILTGCVTPNVDTVTVPDENVVTLLIYGGWDYEKDVKNQDIEIALEDEWAQTIFDIFYNHEMQIIDSPPLSAATFAFKIGEDFLETSMGALKSLTGRINGKLVLVKLSDSEYDAVYQIISPFAQDIPG